MADTLLVISPNGIPLYSARGLHQTLEPIEASKAVERDVNGGAVDLSAPQMRKYKSTITCDDTDPPSFDGLWPGMIVTVDCVKELGYLTSGGSPGRPVIAGTSRVDGDYTFYRPRLVMIVIDYQDKRDEWGAAESWQLDLEEA